MAVSEQNISDVPSSLSELFRAVNSVYEQTGILLRDAIRLLRDDHGIFLNHQKPWDYSQKPNDWLLGQEYSCVRRHWCTFLPAGDIRLAAMFCVEFFHPHRPIVPTIMFGTCDAGDCSFEDFDKWRMFAVTNDVEAGKVAAVMDPPFGVIRGHAPKQWAEVVLTRVPLESITDTATLRKNIVMPLRELLLGRREDARRLLAEVPTILWPSSADESDSGIDDSES